MDPNSKLVELGIELPPPPKPAGVYVPFQLHNGVLYVAGQLPWVGNKFLFEGILGRDLSVEQGYKAARQCALNALSIINAALDGELNRMAKILRLTVWVAAADNFYDQPQVANGASELFADVFGDSGAHSRVTTGVNVLPKNAPIMVDLVAAVSENG